MRSERRWCMQMHGFEVSSSAGRSRRLYCESIAQCDSWVWYLNKLATGPVNPSIPGLKPQNMCHLCTISSMPENSFPNLSVCVSAGALDRPLSGGLARSHRQVISHIHFHGPLSTHSQCHMHVHHHSHVHARVTCRSSWLVGMQWSVRRCREVRR